MKKLKKFLISFATVLLSSVVFPVACYAEGKLNVNLDGNNMQTVEIVIMLTLIALIPTILIMMSSFTRIIIVLSFLRNALGLQQTPPNQVLIGIALFLSLFIMSPVITEINKTAYEPYQKEQITQEQFLEKAQVPLKKFMLKQTKKEEINLFVKLSKTEIVKDNNVDKLSNEELLQKLPMTVVTPAFIISELKRAFMIGFLIFIPFLIIDMIVSSTLMSMGMIMLPPVMISLPFKLLLFVLVDGWSLLIKTLALSFN
ncbi:flagellar type III secretion system pore protein FliP [Paludicola sp. MB14-C6]|uniref:flagellar type III secretion system pore protein FliP n=1 Tax=Paludihabitans sp. MB14-C6 TaxID=3070656 RepID=UPI0035A2712F